MVVEISKGDRVVATRDLGLFDAVPKGTEGVVVSEPGPLGHFEVRFENGEHVDGVSDSDVARI
jgi:hypothetical protein